ncbi:MAG TPA: hypothetical protein VGB89_13200 [Bacteroidota bacterium]|jgi:rubrerythrin
MIIEEIDSMSVEELIGRAIRQEEAGLQFYEKAYHAAGNEAAHAFEELANDTLARIRKLQRLRAEIADMRLIAGAMAD